MLKKEWMSRLSAAGFAALFVFGCSPDSTGSKLVTVQVSLARADAAPTAALAPQNVTAGAVDLGNVSALTVTLDSVQLQTSGSDAWQTVQPTTSGGTLDLLNLPAASIPLALGTVTLQTGACEARLFVKDAKITFAQSVQVGQQSFAGGTPIDVRIPSGPQTGLKADGTCNVQAGPPATVTLTFDANATVGTIVATGNGILLTPVIHIQQH